MKFSDCLPFSMHCVSLPPPFVSLGHREMEKMAFAVKVLLVFVFWPYLQSQTSRGRGLYWLLTRETKRES